MDSDKIKKIFGSSLKDLRNSKGITQEKLSELLEMQVNTVNRIENGTNFVTSETFAKLCNIFEVDPTIFFNNRLKLLSEKDLNYIQEIKRLLPILPNSKLKEVYEILLVIKNNL